MNEWAEYAETMRIARAEWWDEVNAIRQALGINVLDFSEEPTDFDHKLLHCFGIKWEGDERGR